MLFWHVSRSLLKILGDSAVLCVKGRVVTEVVVGIDRSNDAGKLVLVKAGR